MNLPKCSNMNLHYFSIIQALIRTAVCMVPKGEKPTDAFTHQVERLKKALKADGLDAYALSIGEILDTPTNEMQEVKIVRSDDIL
jgi:hypothetical protein